MGFFLSWFFTIIRFDKTKGEGAESEPAVVVKKVEPDFSVSGKLAAETNTLNVSQSSYGKYSACYNDGDYREY